MTNSSSKKEDTTAVLLSDKDRLQVVAKKDWNKNDPLYGGTASMGMSLMNLSMESEKKFYMDIAQEATELCTSMEKESKFIDPEKEACRPRFAEDEIVLGEKLGTGGYSSVFVLKDIQLRHFPKNEGTTEQGGVNEQNEAAREHLTKQVRQQQPQSQEKEEEEKEEEEFFEETGPSSRNDPNGNHSGRSNSSNHSTITTNSSSGDSRDSSRFAVKFLIANITSLTKMREGALDLIREVKFLSNLQHKNIITLHGISDGGPAGFSTGTVGSFFLIVDRVGETLLDRQKRWKKTKRTRSGEKLHAMMQYLTTGGGRRQQQQKEQQQTNVEKPAMNRRRKVSSSLSSSSHHDSSHNHHTRHDQFMERLWVAYDLAAPLQYLHSYNIVFRDLKPENIGFSIHDGTLKLFDFGLAIELNQYTKVVSSTKDDDDVISSSSSSSSSSPPKNNALYVVNHFAGTHPYQSPEMTLLQPYGVSTDTYAFGILCWELLRCKDPFGHMMSHEYMGKVIHGGERPPLPDRWPKQLLALLQNCWDPNPMKRFSMNHVRDTIHQIIQDHSDDRSFR